MSEFDIPSSEAALESFSTPEFIECIESLKETHNITVRIHALATEIDDSVEFTIFLIHPFLPISDVQDAKKALMTVLLKKQVITLLHFCYFFKKN